jgi:hypothetical protein
MPWQLTGFVLAELVALGTLGVLLIRRLRAWRAARAIGERQPQLRRRIATVLSLAVIGVFVLPIGSSAYALGISDCKDAPRVEQPTDGLVASLDSGVSDLAGSLPAQGQPGTPYGDYGYAGMTWQTYDLGCGGDARDPVAAATTWAANQLFNVAKLEVALFNGTHYALLDNGSFDWLDQLTTSLGNVLFDGIFTPWVGLALLMLAILLFSYAARQDLAGLSRRVAWGIIALTFAAATAATPLVYETFVRSTVVDLSNDASNGLLSDSSGRNAVPDYLVNGVLYPAWQKGQFGSTTNYAAKTYSSQLLATKACSKAELHAKCDTGKKKSAFKSTAGRIGDDSGDGGDAYHVLQGRSDARMSAAAQALVSATIATSFQIVALIVLALSILTVAIMVILGGVVGLLAIVNPDTMRGVFRVFGTALINAVIMAIFAGIHARVVLWVTAQSSIPWILQEVGLALVTVLLLIIAQPFKRAKTMLSAVLDTVGGTGSPSGLLGRRNAEKPATPVDEYWQRQRQADYQAEPAHQRDTTIPEERTGGGHLPQVMGATPSPADHPAAMKAVGWAANAMPEAKAALVATERGQELAGTLGIESAKAPEAGSPVRAELVSSQHTGPEAASGREQEDWHRATPDGGDPELVSHVAGESVHVITTASVAVEEPYRPERGSAGDREEAYA